MDMDDRVITSMSETIKQIHRVLWPNGCDSEWNSETIEEVARIMNNNGFGPKENDKLNMWSDGLICIVAESAKEAVELAKKEYGGYSYQEEDFVIINKDKLFTYVDSKEKTIEEWIAIKGKGFFCSLDY